MRRIWLFLLLLPAGAALAQEPPHAPNPAEADAPVPVLTADEGRQIYDLGLKTGAAQASVQILQQQMKPVLDKLASPKK